MTDELGDGVQQNVVSYRLKIYRCISVGILDAHYQRFLIIYFNDFLAQALPPPLKKKCFFLGVYAQ